MPLSSPTPLSVRPPQSPFPAHPLARTRHEHRERPRSTRAAVTKSYRLRDEDGKYSRKLVLMSVLGTVVSAQLQTAAQGFFPWGFLHGGQNAAPEGCNHHKKTDDLDAGDAVPFLIAFFVDGVVLAYDAEPTEPFVAPAGCGWGTWWRLQWTRLKPAFSVLTLVRLLTMPHGGRPACVAPWRAPPEASA